jgi:hypothetical protein
MFKALIVSILLYSSTLLANCIDFSGKYVTNRGSSEGETIISHLVITQTKCQQLTLQFFMPDGNNFSKTYLLDGKQHLSFDDGLIIMHEQASFKDRALVITGTTERRYSDEKDITETFLYLDSDNNLSEYKYIFDKNHDQIGTVITGFRRL